MDIDKWVSDLEDIRKAKKEKKKADSEEEQYFQDLKDKRKQRYELTKEDVMDEERDKARKAALLKLRGQD